MARWRALPAGLDPAVAKLVVRLRKLKDVSGDTLPELAARTGYSVSSWERYLGGRTLPPRDAVEKLADAVGADSVRLLALHETAEEAWRGRAPGGAVAEAEPSDREQPDAEQAEGEHTLGGRSLGEGPGEPVDAEGASSLRLRRPTRQSLLSGAVGAVAGAGVALLVVLPTRGGPAPANRPLAVSTHRVTYSCVYTRRAGLWYAGNSTTTTRQLTVDTWGPDVAELQCLLQRQGITPGGVDGAFGPLTETAVIRAQKAHHLDVDGEVGPQTWAALRQ